MAKFNYSDEDKALAHDQERYVWEGDSGFEFTTPEGPILPSVQAISEAFEWGFSVGWDRARAKSHTLNEDGSKVTVADLINELRRLPQDLEVWKMNDEGYCEAPWSQCEMYLSGERVYL